ncbi:RNA polymerase sigma factor [Streptomyces ovatisporus]|uniref:RNA polymerase sigma factor n=1 Tax=Streptomyces ovatisporus TaxID=1128682 RepID=A0ABV9A9U4_9ACTN
MRQQRGSRTGVLPMTELPADFRAFHQLYRGRYIQWAELYLRSRAEAEDAVDDAFEQLYMAWPAVLQQKHPNAYAWKVVKNRTIDHARARGRRPTVVDTAAFEADAVRFAIDPIGELEEVLPIYQAIETLPCRQHDVIVLYCLGYSAKDVADLLGITEAGVRSTARFARRRLQEALEAETTGGKRR